MTKHKYKDLDFSTFNLIKHQLKVQKSMDITIVGKSMIPLYNPEGQVLKISYIEDLETLRRFDVIVFWQNNMLISHYYWRKNLYFNDPNEPSLMTRPLNPIKSFDHPIKSEQILGILPDKISLWLKIKILFKLLI